MFPKRGVGHIYVILCPPIKLMWNKKDVKIVYKVKEM